jgi:hypothetical protein
MNPATQSHRQESEANAEGMEQAVEVQEVDEVSERPDGRKNPDFAYGVKDLKRRTGVIKATSPDQGLTVKVKEAIDLMVTTGASRAECAAMVGMSDGALYRALKVDNVRSYFDQSLMVFKTSLRPRAVHKLGHLMDKAESERVQLEAAKYLEGMGNAGGIQINLGVQTNISPGYMVDVTTKQSGASEILQRAGSVRKVKT